MNVVLFLCTGNYYRSRFAEIVFNAVAEEQRLAWRAESRGLRINPNNPGPISRHTIEALMAMNIAMPAVRDPLPLAEIDLRSASRVVALKEAEHRPLMAEHFPEWIDRVEFWHIHDLDCAEPADALPQLGVQVRALVKSLALDA